MLYTASKSRSTVEKLNQKPLLRTHGELDPVGALWSPAEDFMESAFMIGKGKTADKKWHPSGKRIRSHETAAPQQISIQSATKPGRIPRISETFPSFRRGRTPSARGL
jgi:predicted esterase